MQLHIVHFLFQAILVYMFRELLNYSVTAISTSEVYSLSLQCTHTSTEVYVNFWSGNVYHQVCLGSGPRGFLVPKRLWTVISSFLSLFDTAPPYICLTGCPDRLDSSLTSSLPGNLGPYAINYFGPKELERCLSLPTSRILERHDFRSILDYLLRKPRTALDREWLQALPALHKVTFCFENFKSLSFRFSSSLYVRVLVCSRSLIHLDRSIYHN